MDIITIIQAVLRRWYVTLPVLLVFLGIAYTVNDRVEPIHQARGEALLASPELDPSGLPRTVASLRQLSGELATDAVNGPLLVGGTGLETRADATTLTFTLEGGSPADAEESAARVIGWLEDEVEARQAEADIDPVEQLQVRAVLTAAGSDTRTPEDPELGAATDSEGDDMLMGTVTLNDPVADATNPFGAAGATARVLSVAVQSDAGRERVAELAGEEIEFVLGLNPRDPAPIMGITTSGPDPEAVLEAYDHVLEVVALELAEREERADVPPSRRTRVEALAVPQSVVNVSPPIDRSVATIVGLGGLVAVALAILTESIAGHRRRRARAAGSADQERGMGTEEPMSEGFVAHVPFDPGDRPRSGSVASGSLRTRGSGTP